MLSRICGYSSTLASGNGPTEDCGPLAGWRLSGGFGDDDVCPWCLLEINGDGITLFISLGSTPRDRMFVVKARTRLKCVRVRRWSAENG